MVIICFKTCYEPEMYTPIYFSVNGLLISNSKCIMWYLPTIVILTIICSLHSIYQIGQGIMISYTKSIM